MSMRVTLIDYGAGNIRSVTRALAHEGAEVVLTDNPAEVLKAERVLLPGVGAFGHCVGELAKRNLTAALKEYAVKERPFLGICVGMQMLLDASEEFGEHAGLGLIPGRVRAIAPPATDHTRFTLPAIGWMSLHKNPHIQNPLLTQMPEGEAMYFVHSFAAHPENPQAALASYTYHGVEVTAAIARENVMGVQFHPEKSGPAGLALIRRFLSL
jgi:glutamine amidotransferase